MNEIMVPFLIFDTMQSELSDRNGLWLLILLNLRDVQYFYYPTFTVTLILIVGNKFWLGIMKNKMTLL